MAGGLRAKVMLEILTPPSSLAVAIKYVNVLEIEQKTFFEFATQQPLAMTRVWKGKP